MTIPKRGPWSPTGQKVLQTCFGDHPRQVIYCAVSDLRQYFLQEQKFCGPMSLKFVKRLLELSDKVALIMDAASQHRTKKFKEFVK